MSRAAVRPIMRWSSPFTEDRVGAGERRWPADGRPAIVSPEPPAAIRDYPALLAMAESMLATRRERLPKAVTAGEMTEAEAARELLIFEDLVADWRFICTGDGEPAGFGSEQARREALDAAVVRIAAFAADHGGFSEQLHQQAERVIALRWHLDPGRRTVAMARLTHQLRADARLSKGEPDHG
jgi:hypothetical protein